MRCVELLLAGVGLWVGAYWLTVFMFVTLPEWVKPRLRWLTSPRPTTNEED